MLVIAKGEQLWFETNPLLLLLLLHLLRFEGGVVVELMMVEALVSVELLGVVIEV